MKFLLLFVRRTFYFSLVIALVFACTKSVGKKEIPIAPICSSHYISNIKPLVAAKCAIKACHVSNFPFGNFTTYTDLKTRIDNERINILVFEQKLMPPSGSPQ